MSAADPGIDEDGVETIEVPEDGNAVDISSQPSSGTTPAPFTFSFNNDAMGSGAAASAL